MSAWDEVIDAVIQHFPEASRELADEQAEHEVATFVLKWLCGALDAGREENAALAKRVAALEARTDDGK
jgi:hypothetical protein